MGEQDQREPESLYERLARYIAAREEGAPVDVDELCRDRPDLRRELQELALDYERIRRAFRSTPEASGSCLVAGMRVGSCRVIRRLGGGGMGEVYEAEQDSPQRRVALKVIRPDRCDPQYAFRFRRESEILGRLNHPWIASVYEAGSFEGPAGVQPYLVMELVRGIALDEWAEGEPSVRKRLDMLRRIAEAVDHAHALGVVHRDLKPANILVTSAGDPRILDFGVARLVRSDLDESATEDWARTLTTDPAALIGTLPYMSPEQVRGGRVDRRSDVYALGVIGYRILAGRLPYDLRGRPIPDCARIIAEETPPPIGRLASELRGDAEIILGKALEKEPERRYASAADLAEDLKRWLHHEPIRARPPSAMYQLSRFARRNPGLSIALAGLILALGVGGAVSFAFFLEEREARALAERRGRDLIDSYRARDRTQALSQIGRGDWKGALETLDRLLGPRGDGPVELEYLRLQALLVADPNERIESLLDALEARGDPAMAARLHLIRGDLRLGSGDADGAVREFNRALELGLPDRDAAYARALLDPTVPGCAAALARLLEDEPQHYLARQRLLVVLGVGGRIDEAEREAATLRILRPDDLMAAAFSLVHRTPDARAGERDEILADIEREHGADVAERLAGGTDLIETTATRLRSEKWGFADITAVTMLAASTLAAMEGALDGMVPVVPCVRDCFRSTVRAQAALLSNDLATLREAGEHLVEVNPTAEAYLLYTAGLFGPDCDTTAVRRLRLALLRRGGDAPSMAELIGLGHLVRRIAQLWFVALVAEEWAGRRGELPDPIRRDALAVVRDCARDEESLHGIPEGVRLVLLRIAFALGDPALGREIAAKVGAGDRELGRLEAKYGDPARAVQHLRRHLASRPDDEEARGFLSQAVEAISDLIEETPPDPGAPESDPDDPTSARDAAPSGSSGAP